jgi:hypothetical protein
MYVPSVFIFSLCLPVSIFGVGSIASDSLVLSSVISASDIEIDSFSDNFRMRSNVVDGIENSASIFFGTFFDLRRVVNL